MKRIVIIVSILFCTFSTFAFKKFNKKNSNTHWTLSDEGMTFTTSRAVQPVSGKVQWTNIRFGMINMGMQRHQNFSKNFGYYTALDLKNVGIADNDGTKRYRYNGYYLGLSLGVKAGKLKGGHVVTPGVGMDWAFKSKFKEWTIGDKRDSKTKDIDYFNNIQLNTWNPYLFLSYRYKNAGVKVSYYVNNYFDAGYNSQKVNALNFTLLMNSGRGNSTNFKKSKSK